MLPLGQYERGVIVGLLIVLVVAVVVSCVEGWWFNRNSSTDQPGLTKIRLSRVKSYNEGKRAWGVEVTHNGEKLQPDPVTLEDPFQPEQYPECFKFYVDDSFKRTRTEEAARLNRERLKRAQARIRPYGAKILETLKLDRLGKKEKRRNILIIEDFDQEEDDTRSLHNLVWELLEDVNIWKEGNLEWVNVTRVVGDPSDAPQPNPRSGLPEHHSIRMLLVIGRSLVKEQRRYTELVTPGLIQKAVMQVMRHLEEVGHYRRVQLDILRPTTFDELKDYLGRDPGDRHTPGREFDIIHLDMHGEMRREIHEMNGPKKPHLIFTQTLREEPQASVLATDVSDVLRERTKLLVMNACNSSSATGELGIRLVRTFLKDNMECVSATSYRLLESSAKIFYPRFYMSLLLNGSFNKAAADARLALRQDKIRHGKEERDDHYVHWNWSRSENLLNCLTPARSMRLHTKMFLEMILRTCSWCKACVCMRRHLWHEGTLDKYPMYAIHRNFHDLESHVRWAQRFDIPSIDLCALEVEYWLRSNDHQHSVYLHPRNPRKEKGFMFLRIQNLIKNMVRLWVETNFVAEVRVFHVDKMIRGDDAWNMPRLWSQAKYQNIISRGEWSWKQRACDQSRKPLRIKRMLIIDGFDSLVDERGRVKDEDGVASVFNRITTAAEDMSGLGEDIYVITIGGFLESQWKQVRGDFDLPVIGRKFAGAKTIQLEVGENIRLSTYARM